MVLYFLFADYSGGSARVVGSVVVTNLVTGSRGGGWESAEVLHFFYSQLLGFLGIKDKINRAISQHRYVHLLLSHEQKVKLTFWLLTFLSHFFY